MMKQWKDTLIASAKKRAIPVLSFPCIQLLGITVQELITDSSLQAQGMKAVADRCDSAASVSMMDLSVEAEAFGSEVRVIGDEVPTVVGSIINHPGDADRLAVPEVGAGRTGLYVRAIEQAAKLITDRPVLAGVIGPYSLAGRLMGMSEIMLNCFDEPEMVHTTLQKATDFIIAYINAYKAVGANGVVVAEPAVGLLSAAMASEFATPYMKLIVDEVQSDSFGVIYHNCGGSTPQMIDELASFGALGYHFGDAVDMAEICAKMPPDVLVLGNVSPAGAFRSGTPDSVREQTLDVLRACSFYPNFIISSGCDIPPASPWDNIDAFFDTVAGFYGE